MTVLSTTRDPGNAEAVAKAGADHVLIDDEYVARQVREILPAADSVRRPRLARHRTELDR